MKKVLLAMSGGVDSTAAALLLQDAGYEVTGATFHLFDTESLQNDLEKYGLNQEKNLPVYPSNGSDKSIKDIHYENYIADSSQFPSDQAVQDAKRACEFLGINHICFDFRPLFYEQVVRPFLSKYLKGITPNPCLFCNKFIKYGMYAEIAFAMGFDYIASGHYAKVSKDDEGIYHLYCPNDLKKDQSYVLYQMSNRILSRLILPLWNHEKQELRDLLKSRGLEFIGSKHDSQDICFIPNKGHAAFLDKYAGDSSKGEGNFILYIDGEYEIIGKHLGLEHYTIGQRKGLGISYSEPLFVQKIDFENNNVILCKQRDLFTDVCYVNEVNFLSEKEANNTEMDLDVRVRYQSVKKAAKLYKLDDGYYKIVFAEPQRAITPGQAAVFYRDNELIGGGTIIKQ